MDLSPSSSIVIAIFDRNPVLCDALADRLTETPGLVAETGHFSPDGSVCLKSGMVPDVMLIDPCSMELDADAFGGKALSVARIGYLQGAKTDVDRQRARQCLSAGYRGLLTKAVSCDVIVSAIQTVAGGGFYVDGSFSDIAFDFRGGPIRAVLTDREATVLQSVARGLSMKEIGGMLDLSAKTVETYKARATSKLNLKNRREIVEYAIRSGWVQSVA